MLANAASEIVNCFRSATCSMANAADTDIFAIAHVQLAFRTI